MTATHRRATRRSTASKILTTGLAAAVAAVGLAVTSATPASAAISPVPAAGGASTIASMMAAPGFQVDGASFVTVPASNTVDGYSTTAIGGFPSPSGGFGILTTGNVNDVLKPSSYLASTIINPDQTFRGNSARDVTVLKIDFTAPTGTNCLSLGFRFLSEEYPDFVGQQYNDGFIAELDNTSWTAQQTDTTASITAPLDFAQDADGHVVSINSTGIGGLTPANAVGTVYGGATTILSASTRVTPGSHSLYLSLFDQGDARYDSAAFVNDLHTSFVPNPGVNCVPGAHPVSSTLSLAPATGSAPVGTQHTVTATLKDSNGVPIPDGPISFDVTGANAVSTTTNTDSSGVATLTYTGTVAGQDQISACYQPTSTCLATGSATQTWNPPVVVTADAQTETYGSADPDLTYTVSGGSLTSPPTCTAAPHHGVGSYPITCSGASAGPDRDVTYVDGTLTVTPAPVTVTAQSRAIVYGDPEPAYTSTVDGLIGGDTLVQQPTCGVAGPHAHVGSYAITCSGADAGPNYTVGYTDGTLTVTAKPGVVVADDQQVTYGDPDPTFGYHVSGLVGSDALASPATCSVQGPHHDVGTYPITCSGGSAGGDYSLSYQAGTLTVTPAPLTITADNATKVHGTADPTFTYQVSGLLGGDTLLTPPQCGVQGPHDAVGQYAVTCTGANAGPNYTITYVDGTFTVTSLPPTAAVTTPADGAVYFQGQDVRADYSCSDPDGTVVSCVGTVPQGARVDTSTTGTQSFGVTATDNDGLTGSVTTHYRVVPVAGACRGTAASLLGATLGDANPALTPCVDRTARVVNAAVVLKPGSLLLPAQGIKADVLQGRTTRVSGGTAATADVSGATITVLGATIKIGTLSSAASAQLSDCTSPAALSGSSQVGSLTINGVQVVPAALLSRPLSLNLGVVSVALNEQKVSGSTITQTALRINVLGTEIVLGRSIASATCGG